MYRCLLCGTREVLGAIDVVSHRSEHRKANSISYVKFQEVGPDNSSEETGEQTMVKSAAESVERSVWTKRNSAKSPVTMTQSMGQTERGLSRIRKAAKQNAHLQFNNLYSHLTLTLLRDAYFNLKKKAATGVDEVSWEDYGEDLERKLEELHRKLHTEQYKPQPSKRIWIPKPDGKQRPVGMAAVEDKVVQQALLWIMENVYEEDFLGFSYGFRPKRSQHNALDAVYVALTQKKVSWVLDADIKGFFDALSHEWLLKFIQHRITDRRVLRLTEKFLKAGVSEEGQWSKTVEGTPQGSVISPLYANIYLHYVLDLWVHQWRKKYARGELYVIRYADDSVYCFQYQSDAKAFHVMLQRRLEKFGLSLHETKTRLIEFGRFAESNRTARNERKPETFSFLGFTHICARRRVDGKYTVLRKTINKKQIASLNKLKTEIMRCRSLNVHIQGAWLRSVVWGYFNYYGVPGNRNSLECFRTEVCRAWFRSLRRRSHKATKLNWFKFRWLVKRYIPSVRNTHPYPNQRFYV